MNSRLLVGLMTVAMLAACPKEGGAPAAGGSAGKPEAAKPASANKTYTIDGLKLAFELPSGVEVSDPLEMLGSYTYRVGGAVVQIKGVKADSLADAHSLDEAKKEAEMFEDVKVTKGDKTADGWRVEYNHNSGTGRDYKISIRRAFGGAEFNCEASGGDAAKVAAAAKACEAITYNGPAVPKAAGDAPKGDEAPKADEAKADAPKADAPAAPAAGAAGASCAKAVKCCKALNGDNGPACAPLANAPEATCAASLESFKKAVKAAMPKKAADCE